MKRLTAYLARLFVTDAVILFGVVCFLLWLVNCLRAFDVVSVKGQSIGTLALQGLLTLPPLAISFFYVCIGIGLARALQALQTNRELHIIHTSGGLRSLWTATAIVAGAGVVGVLLLSHFIEPDANRRLNNLRTSIAADLVNSTLKPQRFTQVTPGVVMLIGGRSGDGDIQEFFADDRRNPKTRRTYIAKGARVSSDGETYVLELRDGTLQNAEPSGRFSKITFARYDVNVDHFSQPAGETDQLSQTDSLTLVRAALESGNWSPEPLTALGNRGAEGLRVIGICLLVLAMSGFPSGRRARFNVPLEAVVLLIAFSERGLSAYSLLGPSTGALAMIIAGAGAMLMLARPRRTRPGIAS
ncbi:MAG: LptF/LptG family permease [Candidatus Devosia symbiotica]|nr:LptF/LptG family permease [Candidatus Devosia symbiotica]